MTILQGITYCFSLRGGLKRPIMMSFWKQKYLLTEETHGLDLISELANEDK